MLIKQQTVLALLVLKNTIWQPTSAAHLHLRHWEKEMTTDSGVIGGLLLIALLLFLGFFFIEALPILGS